jgi:predicted Zn-dependent protease
MGHEIAHALREHSREQVSQQVGTQMAVGVVGAFLGLGDLGQSIAGAVADVTLNLPKSRTAEVEADRIGVELAARAGYDPRAAVSLWEKMGKQGGGQGPNFLSTHPSHENRISDLKEYSQRVMPLYQAAKK